MRMSANSRILIVDDDHRMANTLVDILEVNGYQAEAVYSAAEALDKVKTNEFYTVLTDIKMPKMNGLELYREIAAIQPALPVVLMTAYTANKLIDEALAEGAIAVMSKPLDINHLLSFFSAVRKETSLVIVDDDKNFCTTIEDILKARNFAVTTVCDPHDWEQNLTAEKQIVMLDMKLNSISGLDILKQIRKKNPHLPVIMVTGFRDEMVTAIKASLKNGAYICLYKPLQIGKLIQILTDIRHQELGNILKRSA